MGCREAMLDTSKPMPESLIADTQLPNSRLLHHRSNGWMSVSQCLFRLLRQWTGPVALTLVVFELVVRNFILSPRPSVRDPVLGRVPAPGTTWIDGREGWGR